MPIVAKTLGIVIRIVIDRTFGTHFHVFHGDSELILGQSPVRIIQGDGPAWVRQWALDWVRQHEHDFLPAWKIDLHQRIPIARQIARHQAVNH